MSRRTRGRIDYKALNESGVVQSVEMADSGKIDIPKEPMDAVVLKVKEGALHKELEAIAQQESLARLELELAEKKANLQKMQQAELSKPPAP